MISHDDPRTHRLGSNGVTEASLGRIAADLETLAQTLWCRAERGSGHGNDEGLRDLNWIRAMGEEVARARDLADHQRQDGDR